MGNSWNATKIRISHITIRTVLLRTAICWNLVWRCKFRMLSRMKVREVQQSAMWEILYC